MSSASHDAHAAWSTMLDRLEAGALRLAAAASGASASLEVAVSVAVDVEAAHLGPLPAELEARALTVLRTLAEAERAVEHRASVVRADLDTTGEPPCSSYLDRAL